MILDQTISDYLDSLRRPADPLEALERLTSNSPESEQPALTYCAVFADYCLHAYFPCDQNSHCFRLH